MSVTKEQAKPLLQKKRRNMKQLKLDFDFAEF